MSNQFSICLSGLVVPHPPYHVTRNKSHITYHRIEGLFSCLTYRRALERSIYLLLYLFSRQPVCFWTKKKVINRYTLGIDDGFRWFVKGYWGQIVRHGYNVDFCFNMMSILCIWYFSSSRCWKELEFYKSFSFMPFYLAIFSGSILYLTKTNTYICQYSSQFQYYEFMSPNNVFFNLIS